jgi:hypothetical protein
MAWGLLLLLDSACKNWYSFAGVVTTRRSESCQAYSATLSAQRA